MKPWYSAITCHESRPLKAAIRPQSQKYSGGYWLGMPCRNWSALVHVVVKRSAAAAVRPQSPMSPPMPIGVPARTVRTVNDTQPPPRPRTIPLPSSPSPRWSTQTAPSRTRTVPVARDRAW